MSAYAELAVTTNFSFLRGASHPQEMVACADALGLTAIGIADRNSFAGVVRAYGEARNRNIKLVVGTRLVTIDGFEVLAYPTDRAAYGRLCRLLTAGNLKAKKGECHLTFEDILTASDGQMLIALPPLELFGSVAARSQRKRGPRLPGFLAYAGMSGSSNVSPPWRTRRRAARFSPACITIAATNRAGSAYWPNSARAWMPRSSP